MKILFIINDPPYGTERCYNALRLALALLKDESESDITVFLMADSVDAVRRGLPCSLEAMGPRVIMKMHIAIIATKKTSGMTQQNAGHSDASHQDRASRTGRHCSTAKQ